MVKKKLLKKNKKSKIKTKKLSLHSDTKKGILVVISFTLAIISSLSFFDGAGTFGKYFFKASQLSFGKGFFLIPISFVLIGLAILIPNLNFHKNRKPVYRTIFIGMFIFIFSILGIFHVLGVETNSGGYLGMAIGYPLNNLFGFWASLVVLTSLIIISFLITFNISLISVKKEKTKLKLFHLQTK